MTQLDLYQPCRLPEDGQLLTLLKAMKERPVTMLYAATHLRIAGGFSRRICDLREMGWPVKDRWVKTEDGVRYKEFWVE